MTNTKARLSRHPFLLGAVAALAPFILTGGEYMRSVTVDVHGPKASFSISHHSPGFVANSTPCVTELSVYRGMNDRGPEVWHLRTPNYASGGCVPIDRFEYSETPKGFLADLHAIRLQTGQPYTVFVEGPGWSGEAGFKAGG